MNAPHQTPPRIGERLRAHWLAQGAAVREGACEARLAEFEARHGVRLPPDLRAYLTVVDGTGRGWFDDDVFCFWSLDEIARATEEFAYRRSDPFGDLGSYFVFADHSICLPAYAIRLTNATKSKNVVIAVYSDGGKCDCEVVAESFTEFAERYLAGERSRIDLLNGDPIDPKSKFWAALPADPGHPLWDRDVDG